MDILRESGFVVRDLPRLHAKMVIAGLGAYFGSGNLTFYGLNAGNTEIGVFANGSAATIAKRMFDAWWEQAATVSAEQISSARERQDELAKTRGWDIDRERQPGHQPPPKPRPPDRGLPQAWIKSQYYRHDGWTIAPGKEHWIGDPGEHDDEGNRIYRKDGVPAGEPRYKVGDTIGVYFAFDPHPLALSAAAGDSDEGRCEEAFVLNELASHDLEALTDANAVVVVTGWDAFRTLDWEAAADVMAGTLVLDGPNVLDEDAVRSAGLEYEGTGRESRGLHRPLLEGAAEW